MSRPPSKIIPLKREIEGSRPLFSLTVDEFRQLRDEKARESQAEAPDEPDLIDAKAAAQMLGMKINRLYRRSKDLPFVRKIGPRTNRYSRAGIKEWLDEQR